MHDTEGIHNRDDAAGLLLGPSERLGLLSTFLRGLAQSPEAAPGPLSVDLLGDLGDLFEPTADHGLLVLDGDDLELSDLGLVRGFLDRHDGWDLVLAGEDPGTSATRRLLDHPQVSFLPWPLDLEQASDLAWAAVAARHRGAALGPLHEIGDDLGEGLDEELAAELGGPGEQDEEPPPRGPRAQPYEWPDADRATSGIGTPEPEAPAEFARPPADPELADIERILSTPHPADHPADHPTRSPLDPRPPASSPGALAAGHRPLSSEERSVSVAGPVTAPVEGALGPDAPPAYFKDQVADLADIAQRLMLTWRAASEEGPQVLPGTPLATLGDELARLVQFTRTLGYIASPPGVGAQELDLSLTVEELVRSFTRTGPDAPRVLFRAGPALPVRADKTLLTQAFDALFFLAQGCAGSGEEVRIETLEGEEGGARVLVEFPPGALEGFPLRRALEPYALRRRLPDLGPNALGAAAGILHGQGGSLALGTLASGRLRWTVDLPRSGDPAPDSGSVSTRSSGGTGALRPADDPFA